MPAGLVDFARQAVLEALKDPLALACALGEYMTEPKPGVWFDEPQQAWDGDAAKAGQTAIALDARTRMMYDSDHVFINGESYRAKGADATPDAAAWPTSAIWRRASCARRAQAAIELLGDWHEAGWLQQALAESSGAGR